MVTTLIEMPAAAPRVPGPPGCDRGFNAKLFLSPTLSANEIDYLYSEAMALDL